MSATTPSGPAAPGAARPALKPASAETVRCRVLPKGAGRIYTGREDAATGRPMTFAKGAFVECPELAAALELEERGWVEILG